MKGILIKSLRIRLALLYLFTFLSCFMLISYYVPHSFKNQKMNEVEGKLIGIKEQVEKGYTCYAGFVEYDRFNEILSPILQLANISYAIVQDTSNTIVFDFNQNLAEEYYYNQNSACLKITSDEKQYQYASQLITDNEYIGNIYLGYSMSEFTKEYSELRVTIFSISILVLIIGLIAIWTIGKRIMSPLYKVIDAAQRIGDGDFTCRVEVNSKDEIGYLAMVFNNMVEKMFVVNYELEHINKELELRVEDRTTELIEAKEKAEETEKLKSAFLAQMSHEIRTPINTIMNYISLIKEEVQQKASDDLMDCFKVVDNGSKRLVRTIDSVLNMSQFYSGTFEVQFGKVNLVEDILLEIFDEYQPFAESKGLEMILNNQVVEDEIICDKYSIQQLFINLVENSIKYTNKGIISIGVYEKDEAYINVVITDSGIGMSEEFLENLWKPFSQEETGYTRKYEGNGLGLALVKEYANINYANISAESIKNVGSKFIIEFEKSIDVDLIESSTSYEKERENKKTKSKVSST